MMVVTRPRRTRDVPGPQPNSFGLIARNPGSQPIDQIIRDRQMQEEQRRIADEQDRTRRLKDIRSTWEKESNNKIKVNTIKRRVQDMMKTNDMMLEERRERLRQLLAEEQEMCEREIESMQETVLERQARMRERARQLKEKKEDSRMEYVMQKYEQQWRNQCEELRSTMSKRLQDEIAVERLEQMRVKDEERLRSKEEDDMYAKMWYADMEAKARREEEDVKRQMSANKDTLDVLLKQMAALEAQKAVEKKLLEEEAQLLQEQAEVRKLEEKQMAEEKRRKQQETRTMLDQNIAKKRLVEARRMQEELAFDMQILEGLLEESKNEALAQAQRKRELRDEDRRYREYLKKLKEEEAIREKEIDRLCNEEVEKAWQRRLAQWRLEKEARQKLLQEVVQHRNKQLAAKLAQNELRREEAKLEREELLQQIEDNRRLDAEERQRLIEQSRQHHNDLKGQMAYNARLRVLRQGESMREWQSQAEAEAEYQRKLKWALDNPQLDKLHPMRRAYYEQHPMSALI